MSPLRPEEEFSFGCGPDVVCFNACCQDLNQFLTPYDVLCMKNGLGITSGDFIKQYLSFNTGPMTGLPIASLSPGKDLICPFVTEQGCRIYEYRPASCRVYPLARFAGRDTKNGGLVEKYFLIQESHCKGHGKGPSWTAYKWASNQGLLPYNRANDLFMDVIIQKKNGKARLPQEDAGAFIMACYDSDGFREALDKGDKTIFGTSIPDHIDITDETDLMSFAFKWIGQRLSAL